MGSLTFSDPPGGERQADSKPGRRWRLRAGLQRFRLSVATPGSSRYQAFISYSHAADGKLAPAVQKSLQRFAKPWYRTRALHIFRDDDSLSANPDLWASVEQALGASEHLILLASPAAARSEWVGKEIAYWIANKPATAILVGLTDGELSWDRDSPDAASALPDALRHTFRGEPRITDLRWAKTEDHLSLRNPRWSQAIADLAAPLHGVAKDELASEEVRQHRRTLRIARGAVTVLVALTVTASALGLVAYSQYRSALSRAYAAEATADLATHPELSLSKALQSTQIADTATGTQALRSALATAPLRMAIASGAGANTQAAWNPAADQIAVSTTGGAVELWNASTGHVERLLPARPGQSPLSQLTYSPNGTWLAGVTQAGAVVAWNVRTGAQVATGSLNRQIRAAYDQPGTPTSFDGQSLLFTTVVWSISDPDGLIVYGSGFNAVFLLDVASGNPIRFAGRTWANGADTIVPSPDGSRWFVAWPRTQAILTLRTRRWLVLSPRISWMDGHLACWTGNGRTLAVWDPNQAQDLTLRLWNTQHGKQAVTFPATGGTITAVACGSGRAQSWVAAGDQAGRVGVYSATGTTAGLAGQSQMIQAAASSPDGDYLATAGQDGTGRVWDIASGRQLELLSDGNSLTSIQFSRDGGLVLTVDSRGTVRVWDAGVGEPSVRLAQAATGQTYPLGFRAGGRLVYGLNVALGPGGAAARIEWASVLLWGSATGRLVRRITLPASIAAAPVPCIRALRPIEFCSELLPPPPSLVTGLPVLWKTGDPSSLLSQDGQVTDRLVGIAVSPDAREIAYITETGVTVVNRDDQIVARLRLPLRPTGLSFAERSDRLVIMTSRSLYLWTPASGRTAVALPQASPPLDAEFSANGQRLVTANEGGDVTVWAAGAGTRVATFHPSRAYQRRVTEPYGKTAPIPPVPVRVAINADGSEVAAGTAWWTVSFWNVSQRRLIAARLVPPPGRPDIGGWGPGGPFQIADLQFSADGSRLLAADYPWWAATDASPPATVTIFSTAGAMLTSWSSAGGARAVDPGAAFGPSGQDLLAGVLAEAPFAADGDDAVFELLGGQTLDNLANSVLAVPHLSRSPLQAADLASVWPSPAQPWAPDGIQVLAGAAGIYSCDACGSLAQLQRAAQTRLAWARTLSAGHDDPPPGSPYG